MAYKRIGDVLLSAGVLDANGISWVYYIITSIAGLGLGSLLIMSYI